MIVIQVEMARVHRTLLSSAKRNRGKDSSRKERARERETPSGFKRQTGQLPV